jgi:hypothetical protein
MQSQIEIGGAHRGVPDRYPCPNRKLQRAAAGHAAWTKPDLSKPIRTPAAFDRRRMR